MKENIEDFIRRVSSLSKKLNDRELDFSSEGIDFERLEKFKYSMTDFLMVKSEKDELENKHTAKAREFEVKMTQLETEYVSIGEILKRLIPKESWLKYGTNPSILNVI